MWKKGEIKDNSKEFCLSRKVPFTELRQSERGTGLGGYEELHQRHIKFEIPSKKINDV